MASSCNDSDTTRNGRGRGRLGLEYANDAPACLDLDPPVLARVLARGADCSRDGCLR
jgi:hypothetical protein